MAAPPPAELCRDQPGTFCVNIYDSVTLPLTLMTEPPDTEKDSEIEGSLGSSRFRASGDAVEQLLKYIGPALVWPVIASAAAIVIIAVGFVLSWTVFRS